MRNIRELGNLKFALLLMRLTTVFEIFVYSKYDSLEENLEN